MLSLGSIGFFCLYSSVSIHELTMKRLTATRIDDVTSTKTKLNGNDETKSIFHKTKWEKKQTPRLRLNKFVRYVLPCSLTVSTSFTFCFWFCSPTFRQFWINLYHKCISVRLFRHMLRSVLNRDRNIGKCGLKQKKPRCRPDDFNRKKSKKTHGKQRLKKEHQ